MACSQGERPPIIDAHLHVCDGPYFDRVAKNADHLNTEAHLKAAFDRHGVVCGVVMGNRDPDNFGDYPPFLRYCVGLDSVRFAGEDSRDILGAVERHLRQPDCVGIKLYPGYSPYYVSDPAYRPFIEVAGRYQKAVAIHTGVTAMAGAHLKYCHPLTVDDVAADFPDVQFILCHFGNPWLVDAAAVISKNPNVAADLSGLWEGSLSDENWMEDNAGYIAQLRAWWDFAGYDRLMYGTDWPLANIGGYIDRIGQLIPRRHHEKVFFANANRIYKLGLSI